MQTSVTMVSKQVEIEEVEAVSIVNIEEKASSLVSEVRWLTADQLTVNHHAQRFLAFYHTLDALGGRRLVERVFQGQQRSYRTVAALSSQGCWISTLGDKDRRVSVSNEVIQLISSRWDFTRQCPRSSYLTQWQTIPISASVNQERANRFCRRKCSYANCTSNESICVCLALHKPSCIQGIF